MTNLKRNKKAIKIKKKQKNNNIKKHSEKSYPNIQDCNFIENKKIGPKISQTKIIQLKNKYTRYETFSILESRNKNKLTPIMN